jgi:MFS family permease
MDLIAILLVTPISDRFHRHRALFFSCPVLIQICGLLMTTYAGTPTNSWPRYGGLLLVGFGLGPTVPITMTWTNEIFQRRHGEVGVAAAAAVVSGLGNLGSIVTTYALYAGWESDRAATGKAKYRKSNWVLIGILLLSCCCGWWMARGEVVMARKSRKGMMMRRRERFSNGDSRECGS